MRAGGLLPPWVGGKIVEADETYHRSRCKAAQSARRGYGHKNMSLRWLNAAALPVSFHIDGRRLATLLPIMRAQHQPRSRLMTDEAGTYKVIVGIEHREP